MTHFPIGGTLPSQTSLQKTNFRPRMMSPIRRSSVDYHFVDVDCRWITSFHSITRAVLVLPPLIRSFRPLSAFVEIVSMIEFCFSAVGPGMDPAAA